ncbi:MAG: hypothetical protein Q9217_002807 [Psora testacea]
MHLLNPIQVAAALSVSLVIVSASPMPWSESLLEEINRSRAHGLSEVKIRKPPTLSHCRNKSAEKLSAKNEIASQLPRYLLTPGPLPLREVARLPTALSAPVSINFEARAKEEEVGKLHTILTRISTRLGLKKGDDQEAGCDGWDESSEIGNEENWMYNGKSRLHESVGKRGEEMKRKL